MQDHKVEDWIPNFYDSQLNQALGSLGNEQLKGIFGLFMFNIQNYKAMPFIISKLFVQGWLNSRADVIARREILGTTEDALGEPEQEARIVERRKEIMDDKVTPMALPFTHGESAKEISRLLAPSIQADIASLYPMQVVGAWTAYESFAGDLWMKSVNLFPKVLAKLKGKEDRIQRHMNRGGAQGSMGAEADNIDKGKDRDIKLSLTTIDRLTQGGFNLAGYMGSILAEDKEVSFTSLREIRAAYSRAFPDNHKGIKSIAIDDALADKNLDALSLVRNLLVHKAGFADVQYIRDRKGVPNAPDLEQQHRLNLDGSQAKRFVDTAIVAAINLAKAVDGWHTAATSQL